MPRALILAGPNGAGKTTFAREFLPAEGGVSQFVNADLIAAGLSPFAPETAEVAAGRLMLERIDEFVSEGTDFAVETTLSGRWILAKIAEWRRQGYTVELYYLRLRDAEQSIERVARRVEKGGHNVPAPVLRRRFERSLALLQECKLLVDRWVVYDNSKDGPIFLEERKAD